MLVLSQLPRHAASHAVKPNEIATLKQDELAAQSALARQAARGAAHSVLHGVVLSAQVAPFWHGLTAQPVLVLQPAPVKPNGHETVVLVVVEVCVVIGPATTLQLSDTAMPVTMPPVALMPVHTNCDAVVTTYTATQVGDQ